MRLNDITELHTRADIDDKDVVWAFIVEEFRDSTDGCIEYKSDRFAVYSEHGKLVEVIHEGNALRIVSADHDAALEIAHRLVDPCEENRESDVYGKIFDPANEPQFNAVYVSFFHSNTDVLKCRYKVTECGGIYEGEFFLDMLDKDIYEGIHEGCPGISEDWPDEYMFSHVEEFSLGEPGRGFEIHVRLNAMSGRLEVTEAVAYLWRDFEDGHRENVDTIGNAHIEIVNIDTDEII